MYNLQQQSHSDCECLSYIAFKNSALMNVNDWHTYGMLTTFLIPKLGNKNKYLDISVLFLHTATTVRVYIP